MMMTKEAASESIGISTIFLNLDWSEPWLYILFSVYVFLGISIYYFRFSNGFQMTLFVFLLIIVYVAEDINEYLAHNHKFFTKHQYFDSSGLFISTVMSFPFLLLCTLIITNWFVLSSRMMVKVKTMQLKGDKKLK